MPSTFRTSTKKGDGDRADHRIVHEGCGSSDHRVVANLGHHARHHVVEIVAVKRPAAGIVGVKGDGDAAHRWHQDGIAHGTCERGTVYRDHLKSVAMKVHRVR